MLEKTPESPLDCKEIQLVNPEGDQSWIFSGRTGAEAPILWPPDVKKWLIWKDPHVGKDWRQEETGSTDDEMVVWHHRLNGHEFEQDLGIGDGQGNMTCFSPWDCKELDTTEELNWTDWQTSMMYRIQENVNYPVEETKSFMNPLRAFKIINKIK